MDTKNLIREKIAKRLALNFFVRCLSLPDGVTVLDEAKKEVDWLIKGYYDGQEKWAKANGYVKLDDVIEGKVEVLGSGTVLDLRRVKRLKQVGGK